MMSRRCNAGKLMAGSQLWLRPGCVVSECALQGSRRPH